MLAVESLYRVNVGTLTIAGFECRLRRLHDVRKVLAGDAEQGEQEVGQMLAAVRAQAVQKQFPAVFPPDPAEEPT